MKITITIEYDSDTRESTVSMNGRMPKVWKDVDFSMTKEIEDGQVKLWKIIHNGVIEQS